MAKADPDSVPLGTGTAEGAKDAIKKRKKRQDDRLKEIMGNMPTPDKTTHPELRSKESK